VLKVPELCVSPSNLTPVELWWLLAIIGQQDMEDSMNGLIYLVGLVVVILAVLSFFGLR
jgi:hypothetical protein